jgi:hypothetical protein
MTDDQRHADQRRTISKETVDLITAMLGGPLPTCSKGHDHETEEERALCDRLTRLEARVQALEEGRNGG